MPLPNTFKTPSFLQKLSWTIDPVKYLDKAAKQYPDIFTAEVVGFGDTLVFVNHPQGIEQVLTSQNFAALGAPNKTFEPILGENGLVILDGERHRRERRLLMPSFHGQRMQSYGELMRSHTEKVLSKIPLGQAFSAHHAMLDVSMEVILEAVFGLSSGERYQQIKHKLLTMLDTVSSPLTAAFLLFPALQKDVAGSPWSKFLRLRASLDELIYAEIAERRAQLNPNRIDILQLLMSASYEDGEAMTDKELRDQLITLLLAGHETSASTMAWGLYWIYQHPQVYSKLLKEIETLGENPDPMVVFKLPYLTAVCNETLRMSPVTPMTFPRVVQEEVELLEHRLEPGTVVVAGIYLLHYREDIYPNAKKFKPERFLEKQYSPYEFLAFGAGARRCIGEAFALFEMKLVLFTILSRYKMEYAGKQPEKLARHGGFNLAPASGIKMIITERHTTQKSSTEMVTAI
jgi:cytochrome P450 family 110